MGIGARTLGLLVIVGAAAAFAQPAIEIGSRPQVRQTAAVDAAPLLALGDAEAQAGNWAGADAAFRAAWQDRSARVDAADRLRELHKRPGFRLGSDKAAVDALRAELGPEFRKHETAHFVLISDCAQAWIGTRGLVLERTRDQFYRACRRMDCPVAPHAQKLVCVLFRHREKYRAFAIARDGVMADWVSGYYSTAANRIVIFDEATAPGYVDAEQELERYRERARDLRERAAGRNPAEATELIARADDLDRRIEEAARMLQTRAAADSTRKTIHECVHLLSYNSGLQRPGISYPLWVSEGLATSFETDQTGKAFGPDRQGRSERADVFDQLAADGGLMAGVELVSVLEAPTTGTAAEGLYSQSDVLFRRLFARDPAQMGRYLMEVGEEPRPTRERLVELFRTHFGEPTSDTPPKAPAPPR